MNKTQETIQRHSLAEENRDKFVWALEKPDLLTIKMSFRQPEHKAWKNGLLVHPKK